jgi:Dockerin type I domain
MRYLLTCLGLALCMTNQSGAVLIASGNGSGNTTAPANDPGFANVGIRGSGSAVYLGDGWVLTADHVGDGSTLFQNVWYNEVPGSAVQLTNPTGAGFTTYSDLLMYKIEDPPDLPSISISSTAPSVGWNVTMIGNGRDRNGSEAYWTTSWAPASPPGAYAGYIWASTNDIRWGTSLVSMTSAAEGIGAYSETAFATSFLPGSTPYEAQGTPGDSGGGVFHQNPTTGAWSLAGIMFSASSLPGQPWGATAYGDATYSADLSVYRSEIDHIMALPGDANMDGVVNAQDLLLVAEEWMQRGTGAKDPPADVNHDGIVNGQDIALIQSNWTITSGSGSSHSSAAPEPSSCALALGGVAALLLLGRRCARRAPR